MFRVSLKTLFVTVSIVAVAFALMDGVSAADPYFATVIFSTMLLSLLAGLIAYDKGYCRAFAIGAIPPLLMLIGCFLFPSSSLRTISTSNQFVSCCLILVPVCGCIPMLVRRVVTPRDSEAETPRTILLHELVTGLILGLILGGLVSFVTDFSGILKKVPEWEIVPVKELYDPSGN